MMIPLTEQHKARRALKKSISQLMKLRNITLEESIALTKESFEAVKMVFYPGEEAELKLILEEIYLELKSYHRDLANKQKKKSKYKGISWNKNSKRWIAQATTDHKNIYLGSFRSEKSAYEAYLNYLKIKPND